MPEPHTQFLLTLVLVLAGARLGGSVARLAGQPAVLGELFAGVLLGPSVLGACLGWRPVDPADTTLGYLSELGVVLLLFEIGLETDVRQLLAVGGSSVVVAVVGVAVPFALGYFVCAGLGYRPLVATVVGATLTATSVGITARVLNELGRLHEPEGRIILGAAVLDDVLGLVLLAVVTGRLAGEETGPGRLLTIAGLAFGFITITLVAGWLARPLLSRAIAHFEATDWVAVFGLLFALTIAFAADALQPGLAVVGSFAAGLVLSKVPQVRALERGMAPLGHLFVPIFFVATGAAVDVRLLNPFEVRNHAVLGAGGLLFVVAVAGKFVAGYAPLWFRGRKSVIGVGMVPRGEVGLIFANAGRPALGDGLFSALTLLVMLTTFIAPPLLNRLLSRTPAPAAPPGGVDKLTNDP